MRADRASARGSPRRCACRDCRSARRRAGSAGRPTARARSRRAGARLRRARRAGGRRAPSCTSSSSSRARSSIFFRGQPRKMQRQRDVLQAGQAGQQIEELEDEADACRGARPSARRPSSPSSGWPSSAMVPAVGRSSPPIRFSSVDLPEPEGPTIDTISPRRCGG